MRGVRSINHSGINTCHGIAKELLSNPDNFLTVTVNNKEYVIRGTKIIKTHANYDDSAKHTTILCDNDSVQGNILR